MEVLEGQPGTLYSLRSVCGDKTLLRPNHWMMNQVKTQEVKIGRSQIIAEVEVSENLTMDSDSYDELQLVAASDS